jgi:hypothetical protein
MRTAGNLGAHAQAPSTHVDQTAMENCAFATRRVLKWTYEESILKRPMPEKVRAALEDLAETSPHRKSKYRKAVEELRTLREQSAGFAKEHETLVALLRRYQGQPPRGRRWAVWTVTALLCLALGAAAGSGARDLLAGVSAPASAEAATAPHGEPATAAVEAAVPQAAPERPSAVPAGDPRLDPNRSAATIPPVVEAPSPTVDDAPAAPPTCPEGTVDVAEDVLALTTGPGRDRWPKAPAKPPRQSVPRFCLDDGPVTGREIRDNAAADIQERLKAEPSTCNFPRGAFTYPINCITAADADAYCRARGGRLPSVAEWEVAMRDKPSPRLDPGTWEWSGDPWLSPTFGYKLAAGSPVNDVLYLLGSLDRPYPGGPKLSWHHRALAKPGLPKLSFRCAYTPGAAPPPSPAQP